MLARRRISDDAAGLAALLELLADHGDSPQDPVPAAIGTPRAADRVPARDRAAGLSGQPDAGGPATPPGRGPQIRRGDAYVLANILRTDMELHRPLPAGSELAQAIAVLARARQGSTIGTSRVSACLALSMRQSGTSADAYPPAISRA